MTQIAIIQTTPQPAPSSESPTTSKQSDFAPHLENAVADINKAGTEATSRDHPTSPKKEDPFIEIAESFSEMAGSDHSVLEIAESLSDTTGSDHSLLKIAELLSGAANSTALRISSPPGDTGETEIPSNHLKLTGKELTLQPDDENGLEVFRQENATPFLKEQKTSTSHPLQQLNSTGRSLQIDISVVGPLDKTIQQPTLAGNETVLQQLQQIINKSNETGLVSIQGTVNNNTLQSPGETETRLSSIVSTQMLEPIKISEKPTPAPKSPVLRQDIQGQYLEAKMNFREQGETNANNQNETQQNGTDGQQLSTSSQSNGTLSVEQSNSFQQISSLVQDTQTTHLQNTAKPVTLPSGTVVYEEDVIQQVIERFQISRKLNDTKLSLKLHPAELGELKIDITVKEGSIKANVIAQSQHVMEIIEKNMSKLKNMLEEQGFIIEEILVTSESDSVTDFNLFDQHLAQQNDYSPSTPETKIQDGFSSLLEDAVEVTVGSATGVNIQA